MTALLELEPRKARADEVELAVDFAVSKDGLHERYRCIYTTAQCKEMSDVCLPTA